MKEYKEWTIVPAEEVDYNEYDLPIKDKAEMTRGVWAISHNPVFPSFWASDMQYAIAGCDAEIEHQQRLDAEVSSCPYPYPTYKGWTLLPARDIDWDNPGGPIAESRDQVRSGFWAIPQNSRLGYLWARNLEALKAFCDEKIADLECKKGYEEAVS